MEKNLVTKPVANLDVRLKPAGGYDLIRLGRDCDGGYLVDSKVVGVSQLLISLGIGNDWSFESDYAQAKNVPIEAFDPTVDRARLFKTFLKSALRFYEPEQLFRSIHTMFDYNFFFRHTKRHHKRFVGFDMPPKYISLGTIFKDFVSSDIENIFLKIDIEGWEYRLLEHICDYSSRICGMVIEFHDVDLHHRRIAEFVESIGLKVCHVHCNNFGPISPANTPLAIEISFSRFEPLSFGNLTFPNELDRPNDRSNDDYEIVFS